MYLCVGGWVVLALAVLVVLCVHHFPDYGAPAPASPPPPQSIEYSALVTTCAKQLESICASRLTPKIQVGLVFGHPKQPPG